MITSRFRIPQPPEPRTPNDGTRTRGAHLSSTRRVKAPGGPQCSLGLRAMGLRGFQGFQRVRATVNGPCQETSVPHPDRLTNEWRGAVVCLGRIVGLVTG